MQQIILLLSVYSPLLPLFFFWQGRRYLFSRPVIALQNGKSTTGFGAGVGLITPYNVLATYVCIGFVVDVISLYSNSLASISNFPLLVMFNYLEFMSLFTVFCFLLDFSARIFYSVVVVYSLYYVSLLFFFSEFPFLTAHVPEAITWVCFSLLLYFHLLKKPITDSLSKSFEFWFATAVLVYVSGTTFIYLFESIIYQSREFAHLWTLQNVFNTFFNCLLGVAAWVFLRASMPENR